MRVCATHVGAVGQDQRAVALAVNTRDLLSVAANMQLVAELSGVDDCQHRLSKRAVIVSRNCARCHQPNQGFVELGGLEFATSSRALPEIGSSTHEPEQGSYATGSPRFAANARR